MKKSVAPPEEYYKVDRSWERVAYEIECGVHSGIPVCCIAFYVQDWFKIKVFTVYRRELNKFTKKHKFFIGYIPCPRCFLLERFVSLTPCTCSLGGDLAMLRISGRK